MPLYRVALAELGIDASDAVAIEDSPSGLAAAKGAGLTAIGLTRSVPEDRLKLVADCVIAGFEEL